ncbi:Gfo/Idh/MocA family protein [Arvimicrobium flavum]|uniref:Gfo/Idh/MocA family protein n=1 Tax=Arvimicrobium flavum TaxID=3393320 RepID=UPI00237BFF4D|nr:Gfo/Idh/MocA family oxidoreductase [Mesorhizobium shangrilense]
MSVRVGVIGAGSMGAGHARMLNGQIAGCEVAAVTDADAGRARGLGDQLRGARVLPDGVSLVRDARVDAVVVASPDPTHYPLVMECLRAGKPVLCEKPLGTTSAECLEVVEAEIKLGRRLVQVGFMRRFDPGYEAMKAAVDDRRLGAPLFLHCIHRNAVAASYTTSDMIILNTAVHELDAARFLLGEEFVDATVRAGRATSAAPDRRPQFLVLETASGVIVDIEAFVDAQYGYDVRAELVCEKGAMSLGQTSPVHSYASGSSGHALHPDWIGRFDDAYRRELQAWVNSIATPGKPVGASAWDGYASTKTAEKCLESYRSQRPVRVDVGGRPSFYDGAQAMS